MLKLRFTVIGSVRVPGGWQLFHASERVSGVYVTLVGQNRLNSVSLRKRPVGLLSVLPTLGDRLGEQSLRQTVRRVT